MTGTCHKSNGRGDHCGLPRNHTGPCGWRDKQQVLRDREQDDKRRREADKPHGKQSP